MVSSGVVPLNSSANLRTRLLRSIPAQQCGEHHEAHLIPSTKLVRGGYGALVVLRENSSGFEIKAYSSKFVSVTCCLGTVAAQEQRD